MDNNMERKMRRLLKKMHLTELQADAVISDKAAMDEISDLADKAMSGFRKAVSDALERHSVCCYADKKAPF